MRCAVCGQLQALLREQDRHVDREMQLGRLRRVHRVRYITARRATANRAVMMALFIEFPGPPVICRATCLVDSCEGEGEGEGTCEGEGEGEGEGAGEGEGEGRV